METERREKEREREENKGKGPIKILTLVAAYDELSLISANTFTYTYNFQGVKLSPSWTIVRNQRTRGVSSDNKIIIDNSNEQFFSLYPTLKSISMKISLNKPRRLNKSSKHTGYAGLISSLCLDKYLVKPRELFHFNV